MLNERRRVVVTGLGALTPLGLTPETFWDSMMMGVSGAAEITYFDVSTFDTKFACELKGYDPLNYMDRKTARKLDPFCQYAVAVAKQAIEDSRIADAPGVNKDSVGVIFGSGIGGIKLFTEQSKILIEEGAQRLWPFFIPMLIPDISSGLIAIDYGFRGPNYCLVSACATGNNNIGDAYLLIRTGFAEAIVCGGSEAPVCEMGVGGFNAMKALSTRNDDPATASRPFDADREGFVLGEGGGALVLEELGHAQRRGARIYAEVGGMGMSADAHHITAPHPDGAGAVLAMEMMLKDAGMKPEDLDYMNMHGTSTPLGDVAETKAVKRVFGDRAYKMNVSSTKSMTGHLLGAAGAVEAIAAIFAVMYDKVPPTINYRTPDPDCDLNCTPNKPQDREVVCAASNAFGFGGHNTSIVFKKYEA
ncbi:MAG TPA: beta-ketoacyl-ACP synthase II [Rhodothermia bacterium]